MKFSIFLSLWKVLIIFIINKLTALSAVRWMIIFLFVKWFFITFYFFRMTPFIGLIQIIRVYALFTQILFLFIVLFFNLLIWMIIKNIWVFFLSVWFFVIFIDGRWVNIIVTIVISITSIKSFSLESIICSVAIIWCSHITTHKKGLLYCSLIDYI